jgi:hypothetical protein
VVLTKIVWLGLILRLFTRVRNDKQPSFSDKKRGGRMAAGETRLLPIANIGQSGIFLRQMLDGPACQFTQTHPSRTMMEDDGFPHSGIPEFPQMIDHTMNGTCGVWVAVEEITDIVGHFD